MIRSPSRSWDSERSARCSTRSKVLQDIPGKSGHVVGTTGPEPASLRRGAWRDRWGHEAAHGANILCCMWLVVESNSSFEHSCSQTQVHREGLRCPHGRRHETLIVVESINSHSKNCSNGAAWLLPASPSPSSVSALPSRWLTSGRSCAERDHPPALQRRRHLTEAGDLTFPVVSGPFGV